MQETQISMRDLPIVCTSMDAIMPNGESAGGSVMTTCRFSDEAPAGPELTAYDEAHLTDYLQLLDGADTDEDWQTLVVSVFALDPHAEPDRARRMYDSHLARARWMTEIGYAHLLGS